MSSPGEWLPHKPGERPWNEDATKPYTISLWSDKPVETDTCFVAEDFATEKEARMGLVDLSATFHGMRKSDLDVPYIMLDGPGLQEIITRPETVKRYERERERHERECRNENAMQAGMVFGVQGYNDAMGYDSEPYDPEIHDVDDFYRDDED